MKRFAFLVLLIVLSLPARAQVNGDLEVVDGKHVLRVWGSHAERGYAAGYLLGDEGKAVFDDYFVGYFCSGSPEIYSYLRNLYLGSFAVDAKYTAEAEAMIQGMEGAGVDLHSATLGRDIDATDILVSNAIVDLAQLTKREGFGCSSLSSWGEGTADDPLLAGHLVITRHLDWSKHPALTANPALVVHFPSEIDEEPWLSIGYAGFFGALSSVSRSGLASFLNMGNVNSGSAGQPYQPILLTLRSGMEAADYDGDGSKTEEDLAAAISDRSRAGGSIIHVCRDEGAASDPAVVECNNAAGLAVRRSSDNTVVPSGHLAATNHFRLLYPPVSCSRYAAISDSLRENADVDCERSWDLMAGAAGQYGSNIQAIQYVESAGILRWAVDTNSQPAYLQPPTTLLIDELFRLPAGVEAPVFPAPIVWNVPNPFNPSTLIAFTLREAAPCRLSVHDIAGRRLATLWEGTLPAGRHEFRWDGRDERGRPLGSGLYLSVLDDGRRRSSRKMMLLK